MTNETALSATGVGRKPARERHAGAVREAESKLAGRLPEMADAVIEMALGRTPERCPAHHWILKCEDEGCDYRSLGGVKNERMLIYAMNRVSGAPSVAGERQVSMEFIRRITRHIAQVFREINVIPDPEERARQFVIGVTQIWMLGDSQGAEAGDNPSDG